MAIDSNEQGHEPAGSRGAGRFSQHERETAPPPAKQPLRPELEAVLESAARLQELVPDAVLVGGSAAAYYARHRLSFDHAHVLRSLSKQFDVVLEALDREGDFVFNRATPGKIILGELGGIEVGIRQLIRKRPLEVSEEDLPSGRKLRVPTVAETVRIKAFLVVKRNQTRDYIDVAAMSAAYGVDKVAAWLSAIDDFYADDTAAAGSRPVRQQVLQQLSDPRPRDSRTTERLDDYKGLDKQWAAWSTVVAQCQEVAQEMSGPAAPPLLT